MDLAIDILLIGCMLASYLFIVLYAILAPWWRSVMGQHIMMNTGLLAVIFTYIFLARFGVLSFLSPLWGKIIGVALYALLLGATIWKILILVGIQYHYYKKKRSRRNG